MPEQTSTAMISAPARASSTAWLRPCPRAAPVTSAILPVRGPVISAPFPGLHRTRHRGSRRQRCTTRSAPYRDPSPLMIAQLLAAVVDVATFVAHRYLDR